MGEFGAVLSAMVVVQGGGDGAEDVGTVAAGGRKGCRRFLHGDLVVHEVVANTAWGGVRALPHVGILHGVLVERLCAVMNAAHRAQLVDEGGTGDPLHFRKAELLERDEVPLVLRREATIGLLGEQEHGIGRHLLERRIVHRLAGVENREHNGLLDGYALKELLRCRSTAPSVALSNFNFFQEGSLLQFTEAISLSHQSPFAILSVAPPIRDVWSKVKDKELCSLSFPYKQKGMIECM